MTSPPPALATLGDAVDYAEQSFEAAGLYFGHGMAKAFDQAVYLVLQKLGLPLDELDSVWTRPLQDTEAAAILQLVQRRAQEKIPLAYLTREAWLGPYRFYVDERVIVPRSFIAELLHDELMPGWMHRSPSERYSTCARDRDVWPFWPRSPFRTRASMQWTCRRTHLKSRAAMWATTNCHREFR